MRASVYKDLKQLETLVKKTTKDEDATAIDGDKIVFVDEDDKTIDRRVNQSEESISELPATAE